MKRPPATTSPPMSKQAEPTKRITIPAIRTRKGGQKLVLLTAYTAPMAELLDAHCDMLMVGDSLGMVVYGMDSTLPVTLEMMIAHGKAVARKAQRAAVIIDMPFGSYQESPEQAFRHAARVMQETGADAVKMEGGAELAATIRFLSERGIPVMGHIGLMPQHMHQLGGFKAQGSDAASQQALQHAALAIAEAGAFAIVLEGIMEPLAAAITQQLSIPTIGIGASADCDGQVLVVDDMLGLFVRTPRFVKRYADLRSVIDAAAATYAREVRSGAFPSDAHCYGAVAQKASTLKKNLL